MFYEPTWQAPTGVRALVSSRDGGVSQSPYSSLNLGFHVGDDTASVLENRARLLASLSGVERLVFVNQVHGTTVRDAAMLRSNEVLEADALICDQKAIGLVIMTADCLPVFFATEDGKVVGVAHAGWRGLAAGVLENTVQAMRVLWSTKYGPIDQHKNESLKLPTNARSQESAIIASFGPAIGPSAFEVGEDVRAAFVKADSLAELFFKPVQTQASQAATAKPKYLANLYGLASLKLGKINVAVTGQCSHCTYSEPERYFSFRRDGVTGRQASVIWKSD